ncbi:Hypothetical predicted protein [Cloeon dipterum]|nr:Hypothetical predicted protein [Cloeon dipterum]
MFLRIILKAFLSQSFKSNDDVTMDNFNSKVKIFEFLIINSKPQTIDLEGLLTFCPDNSKLKELTRVVKLIAAHAPDIKSLFICNKIDCCIAVDFGCVVEALCKLKKLVKLVVEYMTIQYSDLKELCKTLRNLSHLEIPIAFNYLKENNSDNLTVDFGDIEDLKRCFSALKIFKFDIVMDDEFASEYGEMKLTYLCLNHLPKLEILRFSADNLDIPQVPMNPRLLSKTSNMRHLCVNAGCHLSKEVFCNLTHLKIYWSHYGIPAAYLGFPKIKCIVLDCVPTVEILKIFTASYGPNLQTLKVCFSENGEQSWYEDSDDSNQDSEEDSDQDSEENYQYIEEDSDQDSEEEDEVNNQLEFRSIFMSCPKLEVLGLDNFELLDDAKPIEFFAELRMLEWTLPLETNRKACLSNILSAPNLAHVFLCGVDFDLNDMKKVSSMISNQQILRQLKSLTFQLVLSERNEEYFKGVSNLFKCACACLPNLALIQIQCYIDFKILPPDFHLWGDKSSKVFEWLGDGGELYKHFQLLSQHSTSHTCFYVNLDSIVNAKAEIYISAEAECKHMPFEEW